MNKKTIKADALVVGGGITGMQTALDLADQDYQVVLVEKDPSIGGKMIQLSKVFPTLDCCSCITTPKMSAVANHDKIQTLTCCEMQSITNGNGSGSYTVQILEKPRYVDLEDCTGCRQCEYVCPIDLPDPFDFNLGATRAVRVPFSTAVPQIAMIDMEHCILCGKCARACPTGAIDFTQTETEISLEVDTIVLATGFEITPPGAKQEYGGGHFKNVIDGLTMERLLAPTGPYGRILRPGDGQEPESIAYVQCAGSRDKTLGVEYCSRVCCMYAIKQAMLIAGSLPLADITIYYMDIRAFGKGYDQFFQNAKAMGIEFVKGKVAKISEDEKMNPVVRVELVDEGSKVVERTHDMVVLSVGMIPDYDPEKVFAVEKNEYGFVASPTPNISSTNTIRKGIFAAGAATGPMDIVDSIASASAAASNAAAYLNTVRNGG